MPGLEILTESWFEAVKDWILENPRADIGIIAGVVLAAGAIYMGYSRYLEIEKEKLAEDRKKYHPPVHSR
jgi:hypothetical protein